jgi:hypothetical protein
LQASFDETTGPSVVLRRVAHYVDACMGGEDVAAGLFHASVLIASHANAETLALRCSIGV